MPAVPVVYDRLQDLTDVAFASIARGNVIYRGASAWNNLAPGTSGQFLQTNGAGADPSWVTPAAGVTTLDGLTDVNLPTASQGDLLYRNATEWVRLGAGTSGHVLTTGGAAANPAWAATVTDLAPAVLLAPAASARNVVQPTGDFIPVTIKPGVVTPSVDLFRVRTFADVSVFRVRSDGTPVFHPTGLFFPRTDQTADGASGSLLAKISYSTGGSIHFQHASGTFLMFTCQGFSNPALDSTQIVWLGQGGTQFKSFGADVSGQPWDFILATANTSGNLFTVRSGANTFFGLDFQGKATHRVVDAATAAISLCLTLAHNSTGTAAAGFGGEQRFQLESSTTDNRDAGGLSWEWATATDASRKARVKLLAYDTAVREVLRLEASGTAPMIGVLGAAAVVQQVVNAAAVDPATTMALVNQLRAALVTFGFCA